MLRLILMFTGVFLISSLGYCQPSWHIITVDSGEPNGPTGYSASLALDSLNDPHIVYVRQYNYGTPTELLRYAVYNGNNWILTTVVTSTDILEPSLALDSSNAPHISYRDYDLLKYAKMENETWQLSTVEQNGRYTAIAVDSQDNPHIAYEYGNIYGLKYAYFDGNDWIIQMVDALEWSGAGTNNSITTDSQNNPHISYCQDAIGQLRYAHKVSDSWVIEYPDPLQGSTGQGTSICLDNQNRPRISHGSPVRYCTKETGTWQVQQIEPGFGGNTSLALDSYEYPHIAYCMGNVPNTSLRMAHWNGSSWQLETVDTTPYTGYNISLEYDSYDHPHIAYQLGGTTNYLMYAWYGEGNLGVEVPSFTAQPAQNGIKLAWQAENSGPATLAGFNLYRIDLSRDPDKKYVQLNPNLITGNSPYTFMDSSIESGVNYQYRLWATYTDGSREEVGTTEGHNDSIKPAAFSLLAVYPNPAKSLLTCRLSLSQPSEVNIALYDISGRLVLANRYAVPTGEQDIALGLGKIARGVYTVWVESGGAVQSKRIVVMR